MKAREVYNKALALINEREGSGAYHSDIYDFEKNAPDIIAIVTALLLFDESIIQGKKVYPTKTITSLDDDVPLHDALAIGVMPFYLASIIILEEDRERADCFYKLFLENEKRVIKNFTKLRHSSIKNVY